LHSQKSVWVLRGRTIQDCLAWDFEYLYLCQVSKKLIIILKLDFAKAFGTIEHEAILQVMRFNDLTTNVLIGPGSFFLLLLLPFC
jgi:hypothetical protein